MTNLNDSIPFYHTISGPKGYQNNLTEAAKDLYRMMRKSPVLSSRIGYAKPTGKDGKYPLPKVPKLKTVAPVEDILALKHLLHSLAHLSSQPTTVEGVAIQNNHFLAIPFSLKHFAKGEKQSHISGTSFQNMVAALCSFASSETGQDWLSFFPKWYDPTTDTGKRSRVSPSAEFADWLIQRGLVFFPHPEGGKHSKAKVPNGLILLNPGDDQDDEDHTNAKPLPRDLAGHEAILPDLNAALLKQKPTFPLAFYQVYRNHWDDSKGSTRLVFGGQRNLYRVFKYRDGLGGRLYGHFVQTLPKDIRKIMLIDGKPVKERDYSSMQLRLLYGIKDVPLPDQEDFYAHPNYADWPEENRQLMRDDMKMVLTRSVGCATRAETIGSLQDTLQKNNKKNPKAKAEEMYGQFWGMHPLVCPHDAKHPTWGVLQKVESDIALHVLANLLGQGIVANTVHDSFVVKAQHEGQLGAAMKEAFDEVSSRTTSLGA